MSAEPRIIRLEISLPLDDLDGEPITKVVEWAKEIVERVPEEYRIACVMDYDSGGYDSSASLTAVYSRPETEVERQNRERYEQANEATRTAQDLMTYNRLKKKFEGTGQ